MDLIWKDVKGYEGLYQVSNYGDVKSLSRKVKRGNHYLSVPERLLSSTKNKGYPTVRLWKNNKEKAFQVHRLVAIAFIPNPGNLPQVNHINRVRDDNVVTNLEWITNRDNTIHSLRNKPDCKIRMVTPELLEQIKEDLDNRVSRSKICKKYGTSHETIKKYFGSYRDYGVKYSR